MSIEWAKFREDFQEAVKDLEDKYNISLTPGSIKYTPTSFTMTVKGLISDGSVSGEEAEFSRICHLYGKKPEDYGKTFIFNGNIYKLVGINTKARKYPFVGEQIGTGKRYKFMDVNI